MFDFLKKTNQENLELRNNKKWLLPIIAAVFVLVLMIVGCLLMFFEIKYSNKFFPGSKIGDLDLSGMTKEQAFGEIEKKTATIGENIIKLSYYDGQEAKIILLDGLSNPDSAKDFFSYNLYDTIYENYNLGRKGGFLSNLCQQVMIYSGLLEMKAIYHVDYDYLQAAAKQQLSGLEIKEQDALPKIICSNNCQVEISEEKDGLAFNYNQAFAKWDEGLKIFLNNPIELKLEPVKPKITKIESEKLINGLNLMFATTTDIIFSYQKDNFKLNRKKLGEMIYFEKNKDKVYFAVNKEVFTKWFTEIIGDKIDIKPRNATLEMKDGKITSLSAHQEGKIADIDKAYLDLNNSIITGNFTNLVFELEIKTVSPEVITSDINNLGVTEILGTGESSFAGSPTNRRKNIKNGASKLHGLLVKPGEEFSLIKALLPVDAANGYFPELVIKGNKTLPEYGGGLCQVGTTMFRAALASGMPILERQNHSYSVTYYLENGLPGVDATIYDPKPDFRFKNDTENYILIQARIIGDKLYFDFWGTKDGRVANRTKPKTWGLKPPPPTKIIETTDLKPGEKRCTESSHNGISASFNYIVVYGDGKTATTTFTSVYRPWQAVCLLGVEALPTSTPIN